MPAGGPGTVENTWEHQQRGNVCVCFFMCVCVHILAVKVSRLVCRLLDLSCTKPLWEDLENSLWVDGGDICSFRRWSAVLTL